METIKTMNSEALSEKLNELGTTICAIPARWDIYGTRFTWEASRKDLRIVSPAENLSYVIDKTSGEVLYYSFHSISGEQGDTEKAVEYFKRCAHLLSEEFRAEVLKDYREKKDWLHDIETQWEAVHAEMEERRKRNIA